MTSQLPVDPKGDAPVQFYVRDVSFASPQRKKFTLEITAGHRFLRARNQTTKEVEFGVPMDRIREFLFRGITVTRQLILFLGTRSCPVLARPGEDAETIQLLYYPGIR